MEGTADKPKENTSLNLTDILPESSTYSRKLSLFFRPQLIFEQLIPDMSGLPLLQKEKCIVDHETRK